MTMIPDASPEETEFEEQQDRLEAIEKENCVIKQTLNTIMAELAKQGIVLLIPKEKGEAL